MVMRVYELSSKQNYVIKSPARTIWRLVDGLESSNSSFSRKLITSEFVDLFTQITYMLRWFEKMMKNLKNSFVSNSQIGYMLDSTCRHVQIYSIKPQFYHYDKKISGITT